MALWEKFVPKFLKPERKKVKKDTNIITTGKDDIRRKILDAEVQEIIELGKRPQEEWVSKQSKRQLKAKKQQEEIEEKAVEIKTEQVTNLSTPPVYSVHEIMHTYEEHEDGTITLPFLTHGDDVKRFQTKQEYEEWVKNKEHDILMQKKSKLTPFEFYVTQGKRMERPFTGKYWWVKDPGTYACKVCDQKLFVTEHKYHADNGYANFWNHVFDAVAYRDDELEHDKVNSNQAFIVDKFTEKLPEKRAVCSN